MTAIVIRDTAKATWLAGLAGARPKARDMVDRAMACAAAAILLCAVAAALAQLAAELLSFPAPIAVTAMTLMAAALLHSLCRHLRPPARPAQSRWPAGFRGVAVQARQRRGRASLRVPSRALR